MTKEPSEAAKQKAEELAGECFADFAYDDPGYAALRALARVLQEHSDVAKAECDWRRQEGLGCSPELRSLILPDDEPTPPLEEIMQSFLIGTGTGPLAKEHARLVRQALDEAGYQIVPKDQS